MDQYIDFAKRYLSKDYRIEVFQDDNLPGASNTIRIKDDVMSSCPLKDELRETLSKRLRRKTKRDDALDMSMVAVMCIATDDYCVGHVSLYGITSKEMCKIWGVLERTSISSSYLLRQWITPLLNGRTCEGYMGHWGISRGFEGTSTSTNVEKGSWTSCVDVTKDMAYKISGQPETLLSACETDINVVIRVHRMLNGSFPDVKYL